MLKKYRNRLLKVIQDKGFDPKLFQLEEREKDGYSIFTLQLKDSELTFETENPPFSFDKFAWLYTQFTPNFSKTAIFPANGFASTEDLFKALEYWLVNHVKPYLNELDEPDMWELIESQAPLIDESAIDDASVFSEDEKIRVRMSIDEFRVLFIKKFEPSKDELKVIDARLKYLSGAVDRLNKIDWRSVAITTLIAISTTLALDPEKSQILFELFKQAFAGIFQLMTGIPPT